MYKLHSLQHPDWHRTGTSYCYCYIIEIIHHDIVIFSKTYPSFLTVKEGDFRIPPSPFSQRELHILTKPSLLFYLCTRKQVQTNWLTAVKVDYLVF